MSLATVAANMSPPQFLSMVEISPRKVREALFAQYSVKNKGSSLNFNPNKQRADRIGRLQKALGSVQKPQAEQVWQEMIRNYLFQKRPMLKAALDFLGVKNDNGLTDEEPEFFKTIKKDKLDGLMAHLGRDFDKEDIMLYLRFMDVPGLDA